MHWFDSLVKRLAASGSPSKMPAENPLLTEAQRTSRRRFVQGAVAGAVGVGASAYVKPNLQTLGIPRAQAAVSPGGGGGGCGPGVPCPPSNDPCIIIFCNQLTGQCESEPEGCGTINPCQDVSCVPGVGCTGTPKPDGTPCFEFICTGTPKPDGTPGLNGVPEPFGVCTGGICICVPVPG